MKNKGISLIVLIITCVTIIILATAIIVNIAQTNMIENAKEAVVKQDFKTMQDELNMYKADKYVETRGNFKAEDLDIIKKEDIAKIMPSIVGTKYEAYVLIEDGCIAISQEMPEKERTWVMEALGLVKTSTNRPTEPEQPETPAEPEPTVTPVVAVNTIVENENSTITGNDFASTNPVIPVGFKAIETTDATWSDTDGDGNPDGWNNGLVIQDKIGNEFVWVPCTVDGGNGSIKYEKWCTSGNSYTATSDDKKVLPTINGTRINETAQITNYSGFYVARYEASVPENQTKIDGTNSASNTTSIPTVQQGATVWTNIDYTNAYTNALAFCDTDKVKSGLITGTQWDTVCAWIQSETDASGKILHSVTDSRTWGNCSNSLSPANVKGYGTKQTTGYSEYWKAKNIYDISGNTWEWIGESMATSYRICRGGGYNDNSGSIYPAAYRNASGLVPSHYYGNISFRIVLYVM